MDKKPDSFPYHCFLLPVFFILHKLNEYFSLISVPVILHFTFLFLATSFVLLIFSRILIFKSIIKAGLLTTFFLLIFYSFGTIHDLLKNIHVPSFLATYKVLLTTIVILIIACTIYLKRSISGFRKLHTYFNILFGILLCIEIALLLFKFLTHENKSNNLARYNKSVIQYPLPAAKVKPDIFFIVFDEYTSTRGLKKYFNYNNEGMDSILKTNGFYIASNSCSNYNATPFSLATTFNMDFFNIPLEQQRGDVRLFLQGWSTLKQSTVTQILGENGYKIFNFGLSDLNGAMVQTSEFSIEYQERSIFEETLWGRIEKDILWNVLEWKIPLFPDWLNRKNKKMKDAFVSRNLTNLHLTINELNRQTDTPKFIYTHVIMPHGPFLLDRNGKYSEGFSSSDPDEDSRKMYLEQLMYSNKWIQMLSQGASNVFSRPRVVIIEGDHGYRDRTNSAPRESYFMNLNTWYFSDKDYSMLYDSISPVNSFRVILNKYLKTDLNLLKDSTVYLRLEP